MKFENCLFVNESPEAEIKLIDFGLSKKYVAKEKKLTDGVGTVRLSQCTCHQSSLKRPLTLTVSCDIRSTPWLLRSLKEVIVARLISGVSVLSHTCYCPRRCRSTDENGKIATVVVCCVACW